MSDAIRNVTINLNLQRGDIQSEEIKRELASIAAESAKMKAGFEQLVRTAGNGLTTALEQSVASMVTLQGHAEKMMGGVGTSLQEAIAAQKALAETGRVYTDSMGGASRAGEAHTRLLDDWLKRRNALNDAAAEYERRAKEGVRDVTERTPATGAERETTPATRSTADDYREATVAVVEHREEIQKLNEELRFWNEQRQKLVDRFETSVMPQSKFDTEDAGMLDKINAINREIEQLKTETRREESRQPTPAQGARPAVTPAQGARPEPTPATGAQPDSTPATGRASQIPEITAALEAAGRTMERFQQLAENASGLKTWELAVKQNEALRDGLQDSANAMQELVREARSLDEAAALGRELGAALAEVAETAGMLDSVETAANMIADAEQQAMAAWTEAHKERMAMRKEEERLQKQIAKEELALDKELEKLWKEHNKTQEEAARLDKERAQKSEALQKATTRHFMQAGMASGQLLGSLRLLGSEYKTIEILAEEFIMLQTAIQGINQAYSVFTNVSDGIEAYRRAVDLASVAQDSMIDSAVEAAEATAAVERGAHAAKAGVGGLGAAVGVAIPLFTALGTHMYDMAMRQERIAEMARQMRLEFGLTTDSINVQADALQRTLELEKSIRAFRDQFRQVPKTMEEIEKSFEERGVENEQKLETEARRVLRNEIQTKMETGVVQEDNTLHAGKNVGQTLTELRAEQERMRVNFKPEIADRHIRELQRQIDRIEMDSGIKSLQSAGKKLADGTTIQEVAEMGQNLAGGGQAGAGKTLLDLADTGVRDEMARVSEAKSQADQAKKMLEYEAEEKKRMMGPQIEQARFETEAVRRAGNFYQEEPNMQQLSALEARAREGDSYPNGRMAAFQDFTSFAEGQGLASDAIPEWKRAKRDMDIEKLMKVLEDLKARSSDKSQQNEGLEKQLEGGQQAIQGLERMVNSFEQWSMRDLARIAEQGAKVGEEITLQQRAAGL